MSIFWWILGGSIFSGFLIWAYQVGGLEIIGEFFSALADALSDIDCSDVDCDIGD